MILLNYIDPLTIDTSRRVSSSYISSNSFVACSAIGTSLLSTLSLFIFGNLAGDRYQWQVNWPDGLLPGLPPEVMPPNFTCHIKSRMGWLIFFTLRIDGWLPSVALNSPGLGKNGRQSLFKKIEKLPRIGDIICRVAMMKFVPPDDEAVQGGDEDYALCDKCEECASCMYWTWYDTCAEDIVLCCPGDECESCGNMFAKVVRRT